MKGYVEILVVGLAFRPTSKPACPPPFASAITQPIAIGIGIAIAIGIAIEIAIAIEPKYTRTQ